MPMAELSRHGETTSRPDSSRKLICHRSRELPECVRDQLGLGESHPAHAKLDPQNGKPVIKAAGDADTECDQRIGVRHPLARREGSRWLLLHLAGICGFSLRVRPWPQRGWHAPRRRSRRLAPPAQVLYSTHLATSLRTPSASCWSSVWARAIASPGGVAAPTAVLRFRLGHQRWSEMPVATGT